jgi:hypothetical protein
MKELYNILSEFKSMKEYTEFMESLVEKAADGNEISRGMNDHDKSKQEKKVAKEVTKNADGSASEVHYDTSEPIAPIEPEPVPVPPGQQVNIGNKSIDKSKMTPPTVAVDVSGKTEKINTKPALDKNLNNKL